MVIKEGRVTIDKVEEEEEEEEATDPNQVNYSAPTAENLVIH